MANGSTFLDRFFKLSEKKTTVKTEIIAGFTTFMAVAYIIIVNPNILKDAGIPFEAALAATIFAAIFATVLMGIWANFPVAVAPGMGLNAFFTYTVVGHLGFTWEQALAAVFISGIVFLILTVTGVRQAIIKAIPLNLKIAIGIGIGMFIALIGLKNAGIVIAHDATLVAVGNVVNTTFTSGEPAPLIACIGLLITAALMAKKVKGSILIGIFLTTIIGMVVGATPYPNGVNDLVSFQIPSVKDTFLKMDFKGVLAYGIFNVVFTFTIVELFDNIGTLIGITKKAKLMKEDGSIENLDRALTTDAIGTMGSAMFGSSAVTSYVESAAGVAEGGRTGLVALVAAACFAIALFFAPLISLIPSFATAPALIIVGAIMMSEVVNVEFNDLTEGVPAFLTIIMMPLTYSIANGFAFGFISYAFIKLLSGKYKDVSWIMWLVCAAFIYNFISRLS